MAISKKNLPPIPKIGPEELVILQFIQNRTSATVREAADHFAESGKARTTVLTVMERLRAKGLLERHKVAGAYRYQPCLDSALILRSMVRDFVDRVLGGSLAPFAAYMSESTAISDEDVKELKRVVRVLDNKKRDTQ